MSSDYHDADGNPRGLDTLCRLEPAWAASRIRAYEAECKRLRGAGRELARVVDLAATQLDLDSNAHMIALLADGVETHRRALTPDAPEPDDDDDLSDISPIPPHRADGLLAAAERHLADEPSPCPECKRLKLEVEGLQYALREAEKVPESALQRAEESAKRADVYIHACERADAAEAECKRLREELRKLVIGHPTGFVEEMRSCDLCWAMWQVGDPEPHADNCPLALAPNHLAEPAESVGAACEHEAKEGT